MWNPFESILNMPQSSVDLKIVGHSQWPPVYTLRRSVKTKRTHVQISRERGLEIVIPERLKRFNPDSILEKHRAWIEKNLKKYAARVKHEPLLPHEIHFKAIHQIVKIQYFKTHETKIRLIKNSDNHWVILGNIENEQMVITFLKKQLMILAKEYLIPWLIQLSNVSGLSFSKASIRNQSTLWGSCTRAKVINLNARLLLVPHYLVEYVILHELAHTVHLNHSASFWKLLSKFDPNYHNHKKQLREYVYLLPKWVESGT